MPICLINKIVLSQVEGFWKDDLLSSLIAKTWQVFELINYYLVMKQT